MSGLCYREVIMIFLCPLAGLSGNTPDIKVRIRLFHPIAPVCRFSPYGVKKRLIVHILHKWHVPWILRRQWHTKPASDQTVCLWSPCPIRLWWHVLRCLPIDCIHLLIHCRRTVPRQCLPHQFRMWKAVCWLKSRWGWRKWYYCHVKQRPPQNSVCQWQVWISLRVGGQTWPASCDGSVLRFFLKTWNRKLLQFFLFFSSLVYDLLKIIPCWCML